MFNVLPQGITAPVINEINITNDGPSIKRNFSAFCGVKSSLKKNLPPSANGCNNPKGPDLFGPILSCIIAATFLSAQVE